MILMPSRAALDASHHHDVTNAAAFALPVKKIKAKG